MNPYATFVSDLARLMDQAEQFPLGGFPAPARTQPSPNAPKVLIFSPHPDDEVIIGGLPLRLMRELGWRIINVAVTQGSNPARRSERWRELQACCAHLGFDLLSPASGGLEQINVESRRAQPERWRAALDLLVRIVQQEQPRAIFFPHDDDWNRTHIGVHHLVLDALGQCDREFTCLTVETEFWGAMKTPNLLVETTESDLVDLITALSWHVGEVKRNPYHLRLAAWLMDNVRRGGELVGGQGAAAPDFLFGTLYRLRRWQNHSLVPVLDRGRFVSQGRLTELAELTGQG